MNKKTYVAEVVGCRTNQYELQSIKAQLEAEGFVPAKEGEAADLCVVNTCAVTENAESSSRHAVRSLIKKYPNARHVVTGCLAQKNPESLKVFSGVSPEVFSNDAKEKLFEKLFPGRPVPSKLIASFDEHTRAFVKVQDGCSCFCSYCIVPYLRGGTRSRPRKEIISEIRALLQSSYKEIVITGVNVGDFTDQNDSLSNLLEEIDGLPGIERLRLSSINPNDIDENFVRTMVRMKHFCPSLHLVLQSGSNAILKKMRRRYTREMFLDLVESIRSHRPDFTFSTDIIVGFPGETAADFEDTVDIVRSVAFSKIHIFPFSPREGTVAAGFQQDVSLETIKARKKELSLEAEHSARKVKKRFLGSIVSLLTERGEDPEWIFGQTEHGLLVKVQKKNLSENALLTVKITGVRDEELVGEVIS